MPPGVRLGGDVDAAFLPERVDPGRPDYTIRSAPKGVGGVTPACTLILDIQWKPRLDPLVPLG
jgi:UDP-N-acetyl-D-glucosamine dehydrogenase